LPKSNELPPSVLNTGPPSFTMTMRPPGDPVASRLKSIDTAILCGSTCTGDLSIRFHDEDEVGSSMQT
jgi:hypothetical protein